MTYMCVHCGSRLFLQLFFITFVNSMLPASIRVSISIVLCYVAYYLLYKFLDLDVYKSACHNEFV